MATEIGKDTKVKLSLETIISLGIVLVAGTGMWFTLQADIAEAKELPVAPDPEVTRMEFQMKDEMIRSTIMNTQDDVKELKETVRRIEETRQTMKKVCIANYLYVLIMILVFTVSTAFSQVKVIHFNAGWNEANDVEWFDKLSDASKKNLSIDDTEIQKKYAIAIVPTIIVFDDGEEVKRLSLIHI